MVRREVSFFQLFLIVLLSPFVSAVEEKSSSEWETVLVMHFDEGKGLPKDASGYENHALECTAKWASQGKRGKCLYFDGKRSYVLIPMSPSLLIDGPFEVEAWIRPTGDAKYGGIVSNLYWTHPRGWQILRARGGRICVNLAGRVRSATVGWHGKFIGAPLGKWSHIRVRYDGERVEIFVNGKLSCSQPFKEKIFTAKRPIWIGWLGRGQPGDYFEGYIDEVVIRRARGNYPRLPLPETIARYNVTGVGEDWGTIHVSWLRSLAYLYWFGRLKFFHTDELRLSWDEVWTLERSGQVYGVGFRTTRPLEPGYLYRFKMVFRHLPDYIVVDGSRVWDIKHASVEDAGRGILGRRLSVVTFTYVPRVKGEGMIWLIKDDSYHGVPGRTEKLGFGLTRKIHPFECKRIRFPLAQAPKYPKWTFPASAKFTNSPRLLKHFCYETQRPVRIELPLDTAGLPYPTSDAVLDFMIMRPEYARPVAKYVRAYGVNAHCCAQFVHELGVPARLLLQHFHISTHHFTKERRAQLLEKYAAALNRFTEENPSLKAVLFHCEIVGRSFEGIFQLPEFSGIAKPWNVFYNVHAKLKTIFRVHQAWKSNLLKRLKHPERVIIAHQTDQGMYPAAYYYKAGADMLINKCIHRHNVELLVSNARGGARAYGKLWGMEYDAWTAFFWHTHSPEEFEQVLYVWFASGAPYISAYEAPASKVPIAGSRVDNEWGRRWLAFCRFVRKHPRRGEQVVKIAIMRGFGDMWYSARAFGFRFGKYRWPPQKRKREKPLSPYRDYRLLDVFFPQFDRLERFCTGTPFGPVDMIPWDTPLERLRQYELVIFMGVNAMDEAQYRTLREYVSGGGTLVLPLGALRREEHGKTELTDPRRLWRSDFRDFLGITIPTRNGQPIPVTTALVTEDGDGSLVRAGRVPIEFNLGGEHLKGFAWWPYKVRFERTAEVEVMAKTLDHGDGGDPVVLRRKFGSGQVYFYTTESIGYVDEQLNKRFLRSLAERTAILRFAPPSDWLEWTVQRKGETYIFNIFNHGRIRSPSGLGKDYGPWSGKVEIDLQKVPELANAKLRAYVVEADPSQPTELRFGMHDGRVSIPLRVDRRIELILGPADKALAQFYGNVVSAPR